MCVTITHLLSTEMEIEVTLHVATFEAAPTASAAGKSVTSVSLSSISIPLPTPTRASDTKSNSARSSLIFGGQEMVLGPIMVALISYWA